MTPLEAIRKQCVECYGGVFAEIKTCDIYRCQFYKHRMGKGRPSVKLLRKFCLDCMCGSSEAIRECTTPTCTIYPFRFGNSPNRGPMSDEQKAKFRERMWGAETTVVRRTRSSSTPTTPSMPAIISRSRTRRTEQ